MSRRGMTLVECLMALVISSVLVAAVDAALVAGQGFARLASASRGLRQNARAAAAVLRAELEGASPASGDLLSVSDSAVVLRAQRAFGMVCALPSAGNVVVDDSTFAQLRVPDPSRDGARVFRDGDLLTTSDDRWITATVTRVGRGICAGGSPGTLLGLGAPPADLAGLAIGAAVRVFEVVEYRRYRDASGLWWLGARGLSASGWSAASPVAGPLAGRAGLVLRYFNRSLAPTAAPDSVALVEAELHLADARPFAAPGHRFAPIGDSVVVRIAPGEP